MSSDAEHSDSSLVQSELFERTGLAFDIDVTTDGIRLMLKGVHAYTLPLSAQNDRDAIWAAPLPTHLNNGATYVERWMLLQVLVTQDEIRSNLRALLLSATSNNSTMQSNLLLAQRFENGSLDMLRRVVWELDDCTVRRLSDALGS